MEARGSFRRTRTGAISSCSLSTSMVTTARASAPTTRRDGPESLPGPCIYSRPARPSSSSDSAQRLLPWKWSRRGVASWRVPATAPDGEGLPVDEYGLLQQSDGEGSSDTAPHAAVGAGGKG